MDDFFLTMGGDPSAARVVRGVTKFPKKYCGTKFSTLARFSYFPVFFKERVRAARVHPGRSAVPEYRGVSILRPP